MNNENEREATICFVEEFHQAFKNKKNTLNPFLSTSALQKLLFGALSTRRYNLVATKGESPPVSIKSTDPYLSAGAGWMIGLMDGWMQGPTHKGKM